MKEIIVTVGPLLSADADGIALSQTPNGASALALTGTVPDNIAQSQTLSGADSVTLNGSIVTNDIANIPDGRSVVITSMGDDSGITFTITGYAFTANGGPSSVVEVLNGTNASTAATRNIFYGVTSIVSSGATGDDISVGTNGKVVTLDKPRRILLTTTGDETSKTLTFNGTDWNGNPISEVVAGVSSGTVATTHDFASINGIWASAAFAAAITVGTNTVASSRPVFLDEWAFAPVGLQVDVNGTVNFTVQSTYDDPNLVGWANVKWIDSSDTNVVGKTATTQSFFAYAPRYTRITLNSGTGSVVYDVWQSGNISGVS